MGKPFPKPKKLTASRESAADDSSYPVPNDHDPFVWLQFDHRGCAPSYHRKSRAVVEHQRVSQNSIEAETQGRGRGAP